MLKELVTEWQSLALGPNKTEREHHAGLKLQFDLGKRLLFPFFLAIGPSLAVQCCSSRLNPARTGRAKKAGKDCPGYIVYITMGLASRASCSACVVRRKKILSSSRGFSPMPFKAYQLS